MMRWLRRILDRRKAVKERNHKKVIHDLLTMDRSDMVGFVRNLDKSVKKKNEFIDYGGGFLCLLAIPVILVMLFVFSVCGCAAMRPFLSSCCSFRLFCVYTGQRKAVIHQ